MSDRTFFILGRGKYKYMTIGEALKEEQNQLGLTHEEMAAGIIAKGTYSKLINGKIEIRSNLLIALLLEHDIDISNFFNKVKNTYTSKEKQLAIELSQKMGLAVNNHDCVLAEDILEKILLLENHKYLKYRVIIATAYLENKVSFLSENFKKEVLVAINSNSNWIKNPGALRLLSTALVVLDPEQVENEMELFFLKLRRRNNYSESVKERYAMLCDNYLHWRFDYRKKVFDKKNIDSALQFLNDLDSSPHLMVYKLSKKYYQYLFNNQIDLAKKMKIDLLDMGCIAGVTNWPV